MTLGGWAQEKALCLTDAPLAFPLRAPHRFGRGPDLRTNLGAPGEAGQREVVHPCGQPCGRRVDRGAQPVECPVEGVDSAVGDTPGRTPPRLLTSHNDRAHGVDEKNRATENT